ncbi:DUF3726 domain-containing protein [uncultured Roseovarius sp.]|uniref:DUF3726 domain-containing protein n=1 Tax=uncultured Roseovarius sp. TaxID=293344 RepID=UPI00261E6F7C|nr:DUF3726 domain-containing protein [uncultured Roseovarius sp.]
MSWSLNEVEGLARKAARGSGLSWGLAEEAGKSVRWLASTGLPGPEMLSALLTQNDGKVYESLCPLETQGIWAADSGQLCPLITGAVICDHAADIAAGRDVDLGRTSFPMLLLPFVAGAAQLVGRTMEIKWPGTKATITARGQIELSKDATLQTDQADSISVRISDAAVNDLQRAHLRAEIPEDTAKVLGAFAHRTYAPDTPESRLAGAGAGLTDND